MRTIHCQLVSVCTVISLALASCTSHTTTEIEFETRVDSCAFMTPDHNGDTVYSIATYKTVWPIRAGKADLTALHDSILICALDTIAIGKFEQAAMHVFRTCRNDDQPLDLQPVDIATARQSDKCNEFNSQGYVALLTQELMVIGIDNYGYFSGAAHGYGTSSYINYYIPDNCVLTIANMFQPGRISEVIETVRETAQEMYPHGQVSANDINELNTFRITPTKVIFVFQPYDVAPYSMGVIEIPISSYDLYETLSPLGLKALGI